MTSTASGSQKPGTDLTPAEIESLRADKKATLARLRELRAKEKAEQEKVAEKAKAVQK
jgi:hypothetical protein